MSTKKGHHLKAAKGSFPPFVPDGAHWYRGPFLTDDVFWDQVSIYVGGKEQPEVTSEPLLVESEHSEANEAMMPPLSILRLRIERGDFPYSSVNQLSYYAPPDGLDDWTAEVLENRQYVKILKDAGIYDAVRSSWGLKILNCAVTRAWIETMVSRWNSETHTFVVQFGEVGPTLEDVHVLTRLPLFGVANIASLGDLSEADQEVMDELNASLRKANSSKSQYDRSTGEKLSTLQKRREPKNTVGGWLRVWYRDFNPKPKTNARDDCVESDRLTHKMHLVAFLVAWLTANAIEGAPGGGINVDTFRIAIILAQGRSVALGPLFLGNLYRRLDMVQEAMLLSVGRYDVPSYLSVRFLLMFFFERFPNISPPPKKYKPTSRGTLEDCFAARWINAVPKSLLAGEIDGVGGFLWRPYTARPEGIVAVDLYPSNDERAIVRAGEVTTHTLLAVTCYPGSLPCLVNAEYGAVSYNQHRMARQLGYDQGVPSPRVPWVGDDASAADRFLIGDAWLEESTSSRRLVIPGRGRLGKVTERWSSMWVDNLCLFTTFVSSTPFPVTVESIFEKDSRFSVPKSKNSSAQNRGPEAKTARREVIYVVDDGRPVPSPVPGSVMRPLYAPEYVVHVVGPNVGKNSVQEGKSGICPKAAVATSRKRSFHSQQSVVEGETGSIPSLVKPRVRVKMACRKGRSMATEEEKGDDSSVEPTAKNLDGIMANDALASRRLGVVVEASAKELVNRGKKRLHLSAKKSNEVPPVVQASVEVSATCSVVEQLMSRSVGNVSSSDDDGNEGNSQSSDDGDEEGNTGHNSDDAACDIGGVRFDPGHSLGSSSHRPGDHGNVEGGGVEEVSPRNVEGGGVEEVEAMDVDRRHMMTVVGTSSMESAPRVPKIILQRAAVPKPPVTQVSVTNASSAGDASTVADAMKVDTFVINVEGNTSVVNTTEVDVVESNAALVDTIAANVIESNTTAIDTTEVTVNKSTTIIVDIAEVNVGDAIVEKSVSVIDDMEVGAGSDEEDCDDVDSCIELSADNPVTRSKRPPGGAENWCFTREPGGVIRMLNCHAGNVTVDPVKLLAGLPANVRRRLERIVEWRPLTFMVFLKSPIHNDFRVFLLTFLDKLVTFIGDHRGRAANPVMLEEMKVLADNLARQGLWIQWVKDYLSDIELLSSILVAQRQYSEARESAHKALEEVERELGEVEQEMDALKRRLADVEQRRSAARLKLEGVGECSSDNVELARQVESRQAIQYELDFDVTSANDTGDGGV